MGNSNGKTEQNGVVLMQAVMHETKAAVYGFTALSAGVVTLASLPLTKISGWTEYLFSKSSANGNALRWSDYISKACAAPTGLAAKSALKLMDMHRIELEKSQAVYAPAADWPRMFGESCGNEWFTGYDALREECFGMQMRLPEKAHIYDLADKDSELQEEQDACKQTSAEDKSGDSVATLKPLGTPEEEMKSALKKMPLKKAEKGRVKPVRPLKAPKFVVTLKSVKPSGLTAKEVKQAKKIVAPKRRKLAALRKPEAHVLKPKGAVRPVTINVAKKLSDVLLAASAKTSVLTGNLKEKMMDGIQTVKVKLEERREAQAALAAQAAVVVSVTDIPVEQKKLVLSPPFADSPAVAVAPLVVAKQPLQLSEILEPPPIYLPLVQDIALPEFEEEAAAVASPEEAESVEPEKSEEKPVPVFVEVANDTVAATPTHESAPAALVPAMVGLTVTDITPEMLRISLEVKAKVEAARAQLLQALAGLKVTDITSDMLRHALEEKAEAARTAAAATAAIAVVTRTLVSGVKAEEIWTEESFAEPDETEARQEKELRIEEPAAQKQESPADSAAFFLLPPAAPVAADNADEMAARAAAFLFPPSVAPEIVVQPPLLPPVTAAPPKPRLAKPYNFASNDDRSSKLPPLDKIARGVVVSRR